MTKIGQLSASVHSTITMPPGSNTIEGNGKVGSDGEQVVVDETSNVK